MNITPELVRELLNYDPATGVFTWRERGEKWITSSRHRLAWNTRYAGTRAGSVHKKKVGYMSRHISIFKKFHAEHRIAWMWMLGEEPPEQIDHINRDATDNRWHNIRSSTTTINHRNYSMRIDNKSGVTGVCWNKEKGKWHARCNVKGQKVHIGYYDDIEDAKAAISVARKRLNFEESAGVQIAHYHRAMA